MNDLTVTLIQADLHWEDIPANLDMFDKKIREIQEETDLIILPEMFNTGFSMQPEKLAEEPDGPTTQWMAQKAAKKNAVVTGSMIIRDQGRYFNRLVWMCPDGSYEVYDKKHLFGLGKEPEHYSSGNNKLITTLKDWKICPMICYDLRFPAWCRNLEQYDLHINIANWPERRILHWKVLSQARAIENVCYVVSVNRVGKDGNGIYHSGDSMVMAPSGDILYQQTHEEAVHTVKLSREALTKARRMYPFLRDADLFEFKVKS